MGLASCGSIDSLIVNALWLIAVDPHRGGSISLLPDFQPNESGAIESAVRRMVKLCLKGPSLFWCRASAEAILLLRSYYRAGRWNMLKCMATSHLALLVA